MAALTNLLLVLTVGLTVATEVDLQKRIIGGRDCLDNERPYHVKFTYSDGDLLCGGSLISDRWILTAAHCLDEDMIPVLSPHPGPRKIVTFVANYTFGNVDLMLVELQQPTNVPHIPLPDCKRPLQKGDVVQIAGYGSNQVGPKNIIVDTEASVLQCADFTVAASCSVIGQPSNLTAECLLVNTTVVDISPGDSGGGVVFNNVIYGVVKGGGDDTAHVEPAAFLDICTPAYMNWITTITGITP